MILNVKKNYPDAKLPERANPSDAGLDVFVHSMKIVGETIGNFNLYRSIQYIEYDTGLSIQPLPYLNSARDREKYFTYLAPRSSISKYNLLMCNGFGIIDANYVGPIKLRMKYIPDAEDYVFYDTEKHPHFGILINEKKIYQVGDKCGQLVVTNQPFVSVAEVDSLGETDRGANGFGSSGGNSI
jgi:dUTP pyrophosphatase